ncbi:hypothetical protein [Holdemanella biformis]|uniref:hypothetical protein n=1 Tax=Holdemanella biformis TaxID=1735 RepID=UPI00248F8FD0|nr:hypothetical protein [Holdemanella biformis]
MKRLVTRIGNEPAVPTELDMDFAFNLDKRTFDGLQRIFNQLCDLTDILGDDYDLDRLKELLEKDRNGAFDPYSKFPQKGQEVWYWDSENGISRGIVDFVNIDFCDNSLNEFGVDFPDENDFDVFNGSAWGTCIVDSMEAALEKVNGEQR